MISCLGNNKAVLHFLTIKSVNKDNVTFCRAEAPTDRHNRIVPNTNKFLTGIEEMIISCHPTEHQD